MKTFRYIYGILMSFLAIATITSCSEEVEYTPASPAAVETSEYYFTSGTETAITIGTDDKTIVAEINRANTEGEATIDLIVANPNEKLFTIPTSVKFADGEATAEVVIEVSDDLEFFKDYQFSLQIAEKYTNPYIAENNNPKLHFTVQRDDYTPFAIGMYNSWFWEEEWEAVLQYSPSLDLYRFKGCWGYGYDVTLKLDPETLEFEMTADAFASGYVHPSYGMVTAEVYNKGAANYFDPETETFFFAYKWTVSAGSFGTGYDSFTVTEWAE